MTILLGSNAQTTDRIRNMNPGIVNWVNIAPTSEMQFVRGLGGLNLARLWADESWLKSLIYGGIEGQPEQAGDTYVDEWLDKFRNVTSLVDYAIGPNEVFGADRPTTGAMEAMHRCEMTIYRRFQAMGIKYASDSWPPGNIEPFQWEYIHGLCQRDGVKWHGDAISLHEYWRTPAGPRDREAGYDPVAPYLIGRFFFYNPLPPVPVIVTEMGYDNYQGGNNKRGWSLDYQMANRDQVYAGHFREYCELIAALAAAHKVTVIGATGFVSGRNAEWVRKGFDYTGISTIENLMTSWPKFYTIYEQEEPPMPTPPPPTEAPFWWGRFADIARERPEIGNPVGPIRYWPGSDFAIQAGEKGIMVYEPDGDLGLYLPATNRRTGTAETESAPF
jgi:hypothetical protein